ncbi:MAG: histidine kinase [Desulfobacterales bacterium CG23_combo_of_CG06-09_8_20_14_all_52_9]|nr:MAG: histidine kinase [Desulfobacterales bacterium CG23_combo_of_CG06-09_8_20_14_all_52_9]
MANTQKESDHGSRPTKTMDDADDFYRNPEDSRTYQDRYRVFIEDVADAFYETDLKGNFTFFNNALCRIFGYKKAEIKGQNFRRFMNAENAQRAFESTHRVFRTGKGITNIIWEIIRKDGRTCILEISAKLILDDKGKKVGFRGIARDITAEKRAAQTSQALFHMATALVQFRSLDERLAVVVQEVRKLIGVDGASVILIDKAKNEFFFRVADYESIETIRRIQEIRFPLNKGVAGLVYRTGEPVIAPNPYTIPDFYSVVDKLSGYKTRNMLDVPIWIQDRMIGVLCAVNKRDGIFAQDDVALLSTIAGTVAFPIENARINEELSRSYEEVKSLNSAKDNIIHHLSHELKTPVSILSASLGLLEKKLEAAAVDMRWRQILDRAQRNLNRLLEMQYELDDIIEEKGYTAHLMLVTLLDACADELEVLVETEAQEMHPASADPDRGDGVDALVGRLRKRIDTLFGPKEARAERIRLDTFVKARLKATRPLFTHRKCRIVEQYEKTPPVWIPPEVLQKTVDGIIRNAVQNTPDGSRIEIRVVDRKEGPIFVVADCGIGMTVEKQRMVFQNHFVTYDTASYATKKPYDFNAGGKGFDLLRIKIFSERYQFAIGVESHRCRFIPLDSDVCPGDIADCRHCKSERDCIESGGTTITIQFAPAPARKPKSKTALK